MEDRQFTTRFMAILVTLVGVTIAILVIANLLYSGDTNISDERVQKEVAERIKPIGEVYVGSVPVEAKEQSSTATNTTTVASANINGEKIYQQACSACHATGVLNAPKPGDKTAWSLRLAKGTDALYTSAINGIGTMPPKGGRVDMSDEAIKAAVDYLTEQ